ncbi:MAG TPA: S8 family serine peptidase [bacterium]|nr:S8 family serine peptidase [bacterium]
MFRYRVAVQFLAVLLVIMWGVAVSAEHPVFQPRTAEFWPENRQPPFAVVDNPGDAGVIVLENAVFDPLVGEPELPADLRLSDPAGTRYQIVQLTGPVSEYDKTRLRIAGADPLMYRSHFTFICRVSERADIAAVRSLPIVRWVGPYEPGYRIDAEVGQTPLAGEERLSDGMYHLIVTVFQSSELRTVQEHVMALGGQVVDKVITTARCSLNIRLDPDALPALAAVEGIYRIEEEGEYYTFNDETQEVIQSGSIVGGTPLWSNGLTGSGQIIGVMDSGVDPDHCFFYDSSQPLPSSTLNTSHRKVVAYRTYGGNAWDGCDLGHGTHVCGTAAGEPDNGTNVAYRGIAYNAKLTFGDIGEDTAFACMYGAVNPPSSLTQTYTDTMNDGGYIHTNSWGSTSNTYNSYCTDIDTYMWNNKDFLVLFSAGNAGPNYSTVGYPGTAKNLVCVGGSDNWSNIQTMYTNSSRGPVSTSNRMAPTLTAPATDTNESPVGIDSADNTTGATGWTCGITRQYFSGTSMACPAAAGMAALVRQYYMDGYYPGGSANPGNTFTPSAALIKATMINGSSNMTSAPTDRPGNDQGWGRLLMDDTLFFSGDSENLIVHDETSGIATSGLDTYTFDVVNTGLPVKISLVWTDRSGNSLVNDLDLVVTGGPSTYYGNNFNNGWSSTGTTRDRTNPAECIFLSAGTLSIGTYTVRVDGYNVPQGEPGGLQPYALVISGGIGALGTPTPTPTGPTPTFTPSPTPTATPTCGVYSYFLMDNNCSTPSTNFYGLCDPDGMGFTVGTTLCPTDCSPADDCHLGWARQTGDSGYHWQYYFTDEILLDCTQEVLFDFCYGFDGRTSSRQGDFYVYWRCADSSITDDCTSMTSSGVSGGGWTLAWSDAGTTWTTACTSRSVTGGTINVPCSCKYIQVMIAVEFNAGADYYGLGHFELYYDSCNGAQCSSGERTCDGDPVGTCPTETVISQPANLYDGTAYVTDLDSSYTVAESFSGLVSDITGIRIWGIDLYNDGTSWSDCDLGNLNLRVTFYNDSSGLPGSVVSQQTVAATQTDAGYYFIGDRVYDYTVDLTTPVSLSSGWVSVQGASGIRVSCCR